ncbi:hypothetical protein ACFVJH_36110 [Streptomyces decoyicus]|uniref:hypothetical protein n=1 Tax=Streptomyces decoyicus TaxID=249567 RepID=UPI00363AD18E
MLIGAAMVAAGAGTVALGAGLSRYGRRHTARVIECPAQLVDHSFVLFLRPFEEDPRLYKVRRAASKSLRVQMTVPVSGTVEEGMVRQFRRRFGRVVAVGQPGERLPLPGADRFYLPLDDWQPVVSDLIGRARLVIIIAGTGPGTLWELTEAARLLRPEQLLLLVYGDEEAYRRFQEALPQAFAERARKLRSEEKAAALAPDLPDYPPLHDPTADGTLTGLQGIIHFDSAWTPTFVRCDRTAVKALTAAGTAWKIHRNQIKPVLDRVEQRLPAKPPTHLPGTPDKRRRDGHKHPPAGKPQGSAGGEAPRTDGSAD